MPFVSIQIEGSSRGTISDANGQFILEVKPNEAISLIFSSIGYELFKTTVFTDHQKEILLSITLHPATTLLPDVEVRDRQMTSSQYTRINPRLITALPGPSGGVEALLKTLPGVSSSNELSSQYSVRGGNFDENLVYVNGIEIYRPFLVRSGQQEGLSFVNSDLISSISFSAGGFDAEYGDKMASVLDITYRQPQKPAASLSLSLLEGALHFENLSKNGKWGYMAGLRHKSNQYLLGTLDTQGNYKPLFTDLQTLLTYRLSHQSQLSFLGNISRNQYAFQPEVQRTRFGTLTDVKELTVYFEGQENDLFLTGMGALSLEYNPTANQKYLFITSLFQSNERENFDILGQYILQNVETDFGKDNYGQATGDPIGVGAFLNHARNYLSAIVWNLEHKAELSYQLHTLKWGIKYQYEDIFDRLNEWTLIDSAGYALPRYPHDGIILQDTVNSRIYLKSNRLSAYVQNTWIFENSHGRMLFTAGLRGQYWSYNQQSFFSPRLTFIYKPSSAPRLSLRASGGYYHQPAFYRELRDLQARLNPNIQAQESLQFVLGAEYNLLLWNRPFKYAGEIYHKQFRKLIPYELNNVRIRYYANNDSKGYATGFDMKINGEFVPGVESWASLSIMKTAEKIVGATYLDSQGNPQSLGYIPRPTDQLINFSLFFQDYLPSNPSYKVNLGLVYGSGLPILPPRREKQKSIGTMPPYRRLDIGFSKELIGENRKLSPDSPWSQIQSLWISLEVFNLLEINNTISYLWIRDVSNQYLAVPNYLTSRLINLKLMARF